MMMQAQAGGAGGSEISALIELTRSGGPFVGGFVILIVGLYLLVKFVLKPLLQEAKPISDNLRATSDSNALAANANVQASANFKEAAEMSRRAAESWKDCIAATNRS